jgi:hypothetical protein
MAKVKYYYDSENLAYRKIKVKKKEIWLCHFILVGFGIVWRFKFCDLVKHTLL